MNFQKQNEDNNFAAFCSELVSSKIQETSGATILLRRICFNKFIEWQGGDDFVLKASDGIRGYFVGIVV